MHLHMNAEKVFLKCSGKITFSCQRLFISMILSSKSKTLSILRLSKNSCILNRKKLQYNCNMQCSSTQIILNENGTFCKKFYQKEANSISSHRFEVGQFSWSAILHCKHSLRMVPRAKELLDLHIRVTN